MDINKLREVVAQIDSFYQKKEDLSNLKFDIEKMKEYYNIEWKNKNNTFLNNFVDKYYNAFPVPVLTVCGKGTREIRFTKYLAYFLDPTNSHGLQDRYLKVVLFRQAKSHQLANNWTENCKIETEKYIGRADGISCMCDIVISNSETVIFIENKILSSESSHPGSDMGQLERYYHASKNNRSYSDKKKIYIYLTPGGKVPGNSEVWNIMTYKYLVKKGLELLEKPNYISNPAKSNLLQFLMDLSVMSYDSFLIDLDKMKNIANSIQNNFSLNKALKFNRLKSKYQLEFRIIGEAYNG